MKQLNKCSYCGTRAKRVMGAGHRITYKTDPAGKVCSQCEGMYSTYRIRSLVKRGHTVTTAKQAMKPDPSLWSPYWMKTNV